MRKIEHYGLKMKDILRFLILKRTKMNKYLYFLYINDNSSGFFGAEIGERDACLPVLDKFYLVFNIFVVLFKGYIHLSIQFVKGDDYGF